MCGEEGTCKTPLNELREDAHKHYDEASKAIHHWSSEIPRAIDFYYNERERQDNVEVQYLQLLNDIIENGVQKLDRTGTGTISVFGRQLRHKMKNGFPLLTTKKMSWKSMITELLWFLEGRTDLRWLLERKCYIWVGDAYKRYEKYANSLEEPDYSVHVEDPKDGVTRVLTREEFIDAILSDDEFNKRWGDFGPIYGWQWRNWTSVGYVGEIRVEGYIDQIRDLIKNLKENPDSRRLMVSAWNVGNLDDMLLPPCHYGFQVYTRKLSQSERFQIFSEKTGSHMHHDHIEMEMDEMGIPKRAISLMFNARSQDVPLGTPFNISSYALLLEIIGRMVNMVPDELIGNLGDCHIYLNQVDGVMEQLKRIPYRFPKIEIDESVDFSSLNSFLNSVDKDKFKLIEYKHYDKIDFPLSN